MTQHEIQRELKLILEGIRNSTDSLWVDSMDYTIDVVLIQEELVEDNEGKLYFDRDENGDIVEEWGPYQATDWLERLKALTTALSSHVKIEGANHLVPSKEVIDGWNKEEKIAYLNGLQDKAYRHQMANRESELATTKEAFDCVMNYLETTGRI